MVEISTDSKSFKVWNLSWRLEDGLDTSVHIEKSICSYGICSVEHLFFPTFYTQFLLKHGRTCCKTFKYQIRISVMVMWEDWNLDEEAWILEPGWVGCGDLFESQRIARSFILRLSINHGGKPQPEKLQSVFWLLSRLVGLLLLVLHLFMSYYSNLFFQYTSLHQTMPHESGSFIFKPLEPGSCFQPEEQPIELNGDGLLGGFLLAGSKP